MEDGGWWLVAGWCGGVDGAKLRAPNLCNAPAKFQPRVRQATRAGFQPTTRSELVHHQVDIALN